MVDNWPYDNQTLIKLTLGGNLKIPKYHSRKFTKLKDLQPQIKRIKICLYRIRRRNFFHMCNYEKKFLRRVLSFRIQIHVKFHIENCIQFFFFLKAGKNIRVYFIKVFFKENITSTWINTWRKFWYNPGYFLLR